MTIAMAPKADPLALRTWSAVARSRERVDRMIVRYDGWFLVLLAVLLVLAVTFLAAMAAYCIVYRGGTRFSGNWRWFENGVSVYVECV